VTEKRTGFGIIGLGVWGETHLKAYADTPGCELVGLCDLNEELAQRRAEEYSVPFWTTDYRELLERPDLQAVSVVTPDFAHFEIGMAAAQAKKHLLLEKPMATRLSEAEQMAQAAEEAGVILMVDFHNRWNPAFVDAKAAIEAGEVGEVRMISLLLNDILWVPTDMLSWAGQSTVAWFLAAHIADLARWLTGREVERVWSVARSGVLSSLGIDTPDFFQTILEMEGGLVTHLENCWIMSNNQPNLFDLKMELFGSEGSIYVDMGTNRMVEKYTPEEATYPVLTVCNEIHGKQTGFGIESIRHFAECVMTGTQPLVTSQDGMENVRIVAAIHQSAESGEPVTLR